MSLLKTKDKPTLAEQLDFVRLAKREAKRQSLNQQTSFPKEWLEDVSVWETLESLLVNLIELQKYEHARKIELTTIHFYNYTGNDKTAVSGINLLEAMEQSVLKFKETEVQS